MIFFSKKKEKTNYDLSHKIVAKMSRIDLWSYNDANFKLI